MTKSLATSSGRDNFELGLTGHIYRQAMTRMAFLPPGNSTWRSSRLSRVNRLSRISWLSCIGRRSRGNRTSVARTGTSACNDRREPRGAKSHHNSPCIHFFKRLADAGLVQPETYSKPQFSNSHSQPGMRILQCRWQEPGKTYGKACLIIRDIRDLNEGVSAMTNE